MPSRKLALPPHIRAARPSDAPDLAYLCNEAGEGLAEYFWEQNDQGIEPWEWGAMRARREEGDFSYRNAHVVERDDRVEAMLLGFVIREMDVDWDELSPIVRPLALLEQKAVGSWYVNALAARPECRGRGLGTELLGLSHALALTSGCKEVSLQNFTSNDRARRLYQRIGFSEVARHPMPTGLPGGQGLPDFGDTILHVMPVSEELARPFFG